MEIGNPFGRRPELPPRVVLGLTIVVAAVWFGLAAASGPLWGSTGALLMGLVGAVGVLVAHERQSGGRWLTGALPLGIVPGAASTLGAFGTADGDTGFGLGLLLAGLVLLLGTMTAAAAVRRRFGDVPDTGGATYWG